MNDNELWPDTQPPPTSDGKLLEERHYAPEEIEKAAEIAIIFGSEGKPRSGE